MAVGKKKKKKNTQQRVNRCRFTGPDGKSPRPVYVDYKDIDMLKRMMSGHGKILGRRRTGNCAAYQRAVAVAVKRARFMGLLPYVGE